MLASTLMPRRHPHHITSMVFVEGVYCPALSAWTAPWIRASFSAWTHLTHTKYRDRTLSTEGCDLEHAALHSAVNEDSQLDVGLAE